MELCDFTLEFSAEHDAVVLQLTDMQIIDASKQRHEGRLKPGECEYWAHGKAEELCYRYVRECVEANRPDLILVSGDNVYGEFDDDGETLLEFISFMEGLGVPWAVVFGNHDNESKMGAEWQCEMLENAKNCIFRRGSCSGYGNFSLAVKMNGKLKRVFLMLDSHGYGTGNGIYPDQLEFCRETVMRVKKSAPKACFSVVTHIPFAAFADSLVRYGYSRDSFAPIDIDKLSDGDDFGYMGSKTTESYDRDGTIFDELCSLGVDSVFVGHEHTNSASIVYRGVRLQFGQKSSCYDKINYVGESGEYVGSYTPAGAPVVGGSVFSIDKENGKIKDAHIYLCK